MSEGTKASSASQPSLNKVKFIHQRAGYYRTVHADGVWGALSSNGNIHLSFFNVRPPIPNAVTQEMRPDGQWIPGSMRAEPEPNPELAVIRQFEVEVILSVADAKEARKLLQTFIEMAEGQGLGENRKTNE